MQLFSVQPGTRVQRPGSAPGTARFKQIELEAAPAGMPPPTSQEEKVGDFLPNRPEHRVPCAGSGRLHACLLDMNSGSCSHRQLGHAPRGLPRASGWGDSPCVFLPRGTITLLAQAAPQPPLNFPPAHTGDGCRHPSPRSPTATGSSPGPPHRLGHPPSPRPPTPSLTGVSTTTKPPSNTALISTCLTVTKSCGRKCKIKKKKTPLPAPGSLSAPWPRV